MRSLGLLDLQLGHQKTLKQLDTRLIFHFPNTSKHIYLFGGGGGILTGTEEAKMSDD